MLPLEEVNKHIEALVKDYNIRIDSLTREQVAEALRQAIACGDFTRYIYQNGQQVVYLPYSTMQSLEFSYHKLEKDLEEAYDAIEFLCSTKL